MILSDESIREFVEADEIGVTPTPDIDQYQPASLDLRLGDTYIDMDTGRKYANSGSFQIRPTSFYLCHTKERISLPPNLAAQITGRSSFGRKGIVVHATSGWADPGFSGDITLEVYNFSNSPVSVKEGERICQAIFFYLDKPAEIPYGEQDNSKYQAQSGPTHSRR